MPLLKVETISKSPFGDINDRQHKFTIKVGSGPKGDRGYRGDTGLINGATQVQVDPTTKVMFDGATIPANTAASRLVGTASGQIPLAQDVASILTGKAIDVTSIKAGAAGYKRGWRKLTAAFAGGTESIRVAHGVSGNIIRVTARIRVKYSGVDVEVFNGDSRAAYSFNIYNDRATGEIVITKNASATEINQSFITIYVDEEL